MNQKRIAAILALTSLSLGGCGGGVRSTLPSLASAGTYGAPAATGSGKIEHVVYIVQENRSFDDMFEGYPGADTVSSGKTTTGQKVELATGEPEDVVRDRPFGALDVQCV